jgi:hypothetical protein
MVRLKVQDDMILRQVSNKQTRRDPIRWQSYTIISMDHSVLKIRFDLALR